MMRVGWFGTTTQDSTLLTAALKISRVRKSKRHVCLLLPSLQASKQMGRSADSCMMGYHPMVEPGIGISKTVFSHQAGGSPKQVIDG